MLHRIWWINEVWIHKWEKVYTNYVILGYNMINRHMTEMWTIDEFVCLLLYEKSRQNEEENCSRAYPYTLGSNSIWIRIRIFSYIKHLRNVFANFLLHNEWTLVLSLFMPWWSLISIWTYRKKLQFLNLSCRFLHPNYLFQLTFQLF